MPISIVPPTTDLARFVSSEIYNNGALAMRTTTNLQVVDTSCCEITNKSRVPMVHDPSRDASTGDAIPISDDEEAISPEYNREGAGFWLQEAAHPALGTITPPNEPDEPLSLEQEPIFEENDLNNLLNTVLDDVDAEDDESLLGSYLDYLAAGSS